MAEKDVFRKAILDAESRSIRTSSINVIDVPSHKGSQAGLGMMIAVVANKGTNIISRVHKALTEGTNGASEASAICSKEPTSPYTTNEQYVDLLISQPVYADIRYGGETLHKGLFVSPGLDVASTMFPYNGGRLTQGGFTLVERVKEGANAGLEALIVRSAPKLTDAETAALTKVPPDQLISSVGAASWCETTWWVVATYTIAATFVHATAVTATLGVIARAAGVLGNSPLLESSGLSNEEIDKLGPTASARSLLAVRRDLIVNNVPQLAPKKTS